MSDSTLRDEPLTAGEWVRVYPGARPGRYYFARVLSPDCEFGGRRVARVQSASGGTDFIAHTHVERIPDV